MHVKADTKLISALSLILAVAVSPISSAVFAEEEIDEIEIDEEEVKESKNAEKKQMKKELQQIRKQFNEELRQLREQFKDNPEELREHLKQLRDKYKDKVRPQINDLRPYTDVRPDVDREPDLKFYDNGIEGWTIIGGKAYQTKMSLEGEAFHVGNGVWRVHSTGEIDVAERTVTLEMSGVARSGHIMLYGTGTLGEGEETHDIRIQLRGNYAPVAGSENEFAITFTHAQIHNTSTGHRIPLALVGSVTVEKLGPESFEPEVADIPEIAKQILS